MLAPCVLCVFNGYEMGRKSVCGAISRSSRAGVGAEHVSVSVRAASVIITATIIVPGNSTRVAAVIAALVIPKHSSLASLNLLGNDIGEESAAQQCAALGGDGVPNTESARGCVILLG